MSCTFAVHEHQLVSTLLIALGDDEPSVRREAEHAIASFGARAVLSELARRSHAQRAVAALAVDQAVERIERGDSASDGRASDSAMYASAGRAATPAKASDAQPHRRGGCGAGASARRVLDFLHALQGGLSDSATY